MKGVSDDSNKLVYYEDRGMGFFDYGIPEQHFSERGREGRAIRLAADTNQDMIYGVNEATALIVTNPNTTQAEMEVMGNNGVQIFNL
jgi:cyanophycinase